MSRLRALYGTSPLHLAAIVVTLVIAGYAALKIAERPDRWEFALWFFGALLLHDFVLYPLYTLLDRIAAGRRPGGPAVNYIRVPALLSALFLTVSLPLVFTLEPASYAGATGLQPEPYLERWLVLTGVVFLVSGVLYAVNARRSQAPA